MITNATISVLFVTIVSVFTMPALSGCALKATGSTPLRTAEALPPEPQPMTLMVKPDYSKSASQAILGVEKGLEFSHIGHSGEMLRQSMGGTKNPHIALRVREGESVEVVFFSLPHGTSLRKAEIEYRRRGLVPADVWVLSAVNATDKTFADFFPNITLWRNNHKDLCFLTFRNGESAQVKTHAYYLFDKSTSWWFAGVRVH